MKAYFVHSWFLRLGEVAEKLIAAFSHQKQDCTKEVAISEAKKITWK